MGNLSAATAARQVGHDPAYSLATGVVLGRGDSSGVWGVVMGDLLKELYDIVESARGYVADKAQGDVGYGFFPGGDPRNFQPDFECATPDEITNHKRACEAAESGAVVVDSDGQWVGDGDLVAHITRCQFGLGTYTMPDERAQKFLDRMNAAVKQYRETFP